MFRMLAAILFVFFMTFALASGNTYAYGFINSDGYTWYNDSYWWWGNDAYTRHRVYQNAYYSYGHYYPASYIWHYTFHHHYQRVTAKDSNWRTKLLEIAAHRDKIEGDIRRGAIEQGYFNEAVKALGLGGNFHWQGYGVAPVYPSAGSYAAGSTGSTVYGYSYNTIAQLYGDSNLAQLYQQAARLAENSQKISGEATQGFNTLVGLEGENRAKVAQILAKSQAISEMLKSIEGSSAKFESKSLTFKLVQGKDGKIDVEKVVPEKSDMRAKWESHAKDTCVMCHHGPKKEGNFDVTQYPAMTAEQKLDVISRITTKDTAKRMPRSKDNVGKVGRRLIPEEIQLWLVN